MTTAMLLEGLGDPELDDLQELVERRAREPDAWPRMVGLLTAVASSPSPIVAGSWVRAAHAPLELTETEREHAWSATLYLFTELCDWLHNGTAVTPPDSRRERVHAYCRGYAAGISLDPHWRTSPGLLALAKPMVVLGGLRPFDAFADARSIPWETWAARARTRLPFCVLDVFESMRASGSRPLPPVASRPNWL